MSSTITTGKRAAAFRSPTGNIIYALFEQSYESNCTPHTPRWSCLRIGGISSVMQRVFSSAAACEGGMLRGRSGPITPEAYIGGWLKELATPHAMRDVSILLCVGTDSLHDSIPANEFEKARRALVAIGRNDISDRLAGGGTVRVSLHQDAEVVCALYGPGVLPPWRVINMSPIFFFDPATDMGYAPIPVTNFEVVRPSLLRVSGHAISEDLYLVPRADGSRYAAFAWRVLDNFIEGLWAAELREPGSYRKRIRAYRDAIKLAPAVALADLRVQVVPVANAAEELLEIIMRRYERQDISRLQAAYPGGSIDNGFEVQVTKDCLSDLCNLPKSTTNWIVPEAYR